MNNKRKAENPYEKVYLKSRKVVPEEKPPPPSPLLKPPVISVTEQPPLQPIPKLKLIIRRKSGDNYQVEPNLAKPPVDTFFPNKSSTFTQLSRLLEQTKAETRTGLSVNVNRNRSTESAHVSPLAVKKTADYDVGWEIVSEFTADDIAANSEELSRDVRQPRVLLKHSIPFPVALVEEKTNVVFTKALLFLHLFQSYAAPCIMCVLCKEFHSVGTFSKHLHLEDIESSSDEDEYEPAVNVESNEAKLGPKKRRLELLRKRTFKILPYFIGANYSSRNFRLNEQQIKSWKLFTGKFASFREQRRQDAQEAEQCATFNDWDYASVKENVYVLAKSKIDNETVVYCEAKSSLEDDRIRREQHRRKFEMKREMSIRKKDTVLSDSESESSIETNVGVDSSLVKAERPIYVMRNLPLRLKIFNYYDNLSRSILTYMRRNEYTIVPQTLVDYTLKCRVVVNSASSDTAMSRRSCPARVRSLSRLLVSL
jgi:hypothetical protein